MHYGETLLVINVTDNWKIVTLFSIYTNLVKWGENFSNLWNSCMFKDMINFHEPAFKFFWMKLEF